MNAQKKPGTDLATVEPSAGGSVMAIVPQSYDEVKALAIDLAMAGDVIPKAFRGKPPEVIGAVILRGAEVGYKPMQALSAIAMINGVASIYGDALSALMFKHGHHIDWRYEGEGDNLTAIATLTRGDTGRTIVREFSYQDAKRARLLTKEGPWTAYPKRMLAMRARAWACRDGAPDVLMGLSVAEEVMDYENARDVTPASERPASTETAMQKKIRLQREADAAAAGAKASAPPADVVVSGEAKPAEEAKAEVEDAVIVTEDEPADEGESGATTGPLVDVPEEEIEEDYDPTAQSFEKGQEAFKAGKTLKDVPNYSKEANKASWRMGWRLAWKAAQPSDGDAE